MKRPSGSHLRPSEIGFNNYFKVLILLIIFTFIIGSHLYVNSQGSSYHGVFLIFDNLYNIFLVICLLFICASIGLHLLYATKMVFAEPLEALLISLAVGIGVLSTIILFLGLVSLLRPYLIGLLFIVLSLLIKTSLKRVFVLTKNAWSYIRIECNPLTLFIFGLVSIFLLVLATAPPIDWDSLVYHVQGPALFLKAHKIFLPSDNLSVWAVQLIHMLYIPLMAFGNAATPGILSAILGLLMGLAVFEFGNRFLNNFVANYNLSLVWASTIILIVCITPRVDVSVALFCFLGNYLLIKSHVERSWSSYYYLAAIILGCAFGVKYSAGFYILALSPLILWIAYRHSLNHLNFAKALFVFALLFCGAISPWLLKNWILFKSPLYPFFTGRQNPAWIGALAKPLFATDPQIYRAPLQIPAFFNLKDYFFHPGHLMVEPEGVLYLANFLFLLLPLSILCLNNFVILGLALPSVLFILGLNMFWPHSNLRYLIPAIPPLTITAVYSLWSLVVRKFDIRLYKYVFIFLTFIIVVPNIGSVILAWPSNWPALEYFIGMKSQQSYLDNHPMKVASTYAEMVSYINKNLTENDKVLLIFDGRGYYFRHPIIQDTEGVNWILLSSNHQPDDNMKRLRITHILTNYANFNYLVSRGINPNSFHWEKFLSFADKYLEPIHSNKAFVLYRLKDKLNLTNSR